MPRRPSPIKQRCPQAQQRIRSPSVFQSEPSVVWRSSLPASASYATRDFDGAGADATVVTSLRRLFVGTGSFIFYLLERQVNFARAPAVVKAHHTTSLVDGRGFRINMQRLIVGFN